MLTESGFPVELLDERYTTPRAAESDPDAAAACGILQVYLDRGRKE